MRYSVILLVVLVAGCASLGGAGAAGLVETTEVDTVPENVSTVPYEELDSDPVREAVRVAVENESESVTTVEYTEREKQAVLDDFESAGPTEDSYVYVSYEDRVVRLRVTVYTG